MRDSQSSTTWNKVMVHKLTYDPSTLSCSGAAASLRYLTQLDVTAYAPDGTATAAPPVKLGYGPTTRQLSATLLAPIGHGDHGNRKGAVGSLMDMNGDGFHDRVWVDLNATTKKCRLSYRRGRRGGWLESQTVSTDLPTAAWQNDSAGPGAMEYCSLNGQRFRRDNTNTGGAVAGTCSLHGGFVSYHFLDLDGDGVVDFLSNVWSDDQRTIGGDFNSGAFSVAAETNDDPGGGPCAGVSCPAGTETSSCEVGGGVGGTDVLHCSCPAGTEPVDDTHCCQAGEAWGPDGCVDPNTCTSLTCPPPGGGGDGGGDGGGRPPICSAPDLRPELDNERFVWRVQHNDGGTLAFPDNPVQVERVYSSRPLPPSGNELTLNRYAKPTLQTLVDIDGDGVLDVVALPGDPIRLLVDPGRNGVDPFKPLGQATTLEIWRGSVSDGDFNVSTTKQSWHLPTGFAVMASGTQLDNTTPDGVAHVVTWSAAILSDLNGDGLPDLVVAKEDGSLHVAWNQQGSFGVLTALGTTGPIAQTQSDLTGGWTAGDQLSSGRSGTWKRLVDIDADGLPDLVTLARTAENVGSSLGVRTGARNLGDRWAAGAAPAPMWDAAKGLVVASQGNWYRAGDLVDLTGDGLPDLVTWAANGDATVRTDDPVSSCAPNTLCTPTLPAAPTSGAPASLAGDFNGATELFTDQPGVAPPTRLLASIDNGRGGIVRLRYAPSTDTQVVGLEGHILPSPRWVVTSVTVEPGFGQPAMRTNYRYFAPVTGTSSPSDLSPPHFLGFARVEIIRPRQTGTGVGSRVVRELDYSIGNDHSGRLVHEQTFLGGVATPITDRQLTWRNVGVLGTVSFSYREQELARTCKPGQTLASCAILRTTDTWTRYTFPASGKVVLYTHERTAQGPGTALALNDRSTRFTHQVRVGQAPYPATDYRVLETLRERQHASPFANGPGFGGPFGTSGRTVTRYNTAGLPYRSEVWTTSEPTTRAVTMRTFDGQTGNLLTTKRPNQINTSLVTSQQYDSHRLYVIRTVNELGHQTRTTTDVGTGVVVKREGPNSRAVPCTAPCTPTRVLAPETWRIDGFGRAIEHRVAADVGLGTGYSLPLVERTRIVETELPNRRRIERLRDAGGTVWVTADDRFDGTGRVLSHTELLQTGSGNAVTRYAYDTLGKLAAVSSPDPRDDAKVVVHRYSRDGLGRVTALVRPDGSSVTVKYLGLDVDSQSNDPNGPVGEHTTAKYDVYGQLVELREHDNPGPGQIGITKYAYDPARRIQNVTDADGVVTTMTHDWADRRSMIRRGTRAWTYGYDFDGNVTSERSPLPAGAADSDFRSSTTYDPLDRPVTHTPASRGLTAARRTELKIGPTTKVYDGADNGVGQLERVTLPFGSVAYRYDVHGRVAREERTFSTTYLAQANATQWVERAYNLLGQPTQVSWDDGTRWNVAYDVRGLPAAVTWAKPGERVPPTLATYARSQARPASAGRPTTSNERGPTTRSGGSSPIACSSRARTGRRGRSAPTTTTVWASCASSTARPTVCPPTLCTSTTRGTVCCTRTGRATTSRRSRTRRAATWPAPR